MPSSVAGPVLWSWPNWPLEDGPPRVTPRVAAALLGIGAGHREHAGRADGDRAVVGERSRGGERRAACERQAAGIGCQAGERAEGCAGTLERDRRLVGRDIRAGGEDKRGTARDVPRAAGECRAGKLGDRVVQWGAEVECAGIDLDRAGVKERRSEYGSCRCRRSWRECRSCSSARRARCCR